MKDSFDVKAKSCCAKTCNGSPLRQHETSVLAKVHTGRRCVGICVCVHMCGYKQVHTRSFFDRSANAFYEIGLVNGIELMYTERERGGGRE